MRIRLLILILVVIATGFQATNYKASTKPYHVSMSVDSVRFFESDGAENHERAYRTRFRRSSLRYVEWELVLTHSKYPTRVDFQIQAVWRGPTGNVLHRQPHHWYVPAGQGTSHVTEGWGCANTPCGAWELGAYRVDFYQGEKKIAQGTFQIR